MFLSFDSALIVFATLLAAIITTGALSSNSKVARHGAKHVNRPQELGPERDFFDLSGATWLAMLASCVGIVGLYSLGEVRVAPTTAWPSASWPALVIWSLLAVLALFYFVVVLCGDIARILVRNPNFRPVGFFGGIFLSAFMIILVYAMAYRLYGIEPPNGCECTVYPSDFLYLSVVTFSTLGYGDFQPWAATRLPAALQAVLGNLHLATLVGAIYAIKIPPRLPRGQAGR